MKDETVWLTQEQMGLLFGKSKSTINKHIKNIYKDEELLEYLLEPPPPPATINILSILEEKLDNKPDDLVIDVAPPPEHIV